MRNLLPKRSIHRPGRPEHVGKLAVCGELVGGALATMLAVTECHAGQPGVAAAAVSCPIVDWVDLPDQNVTAGTKSDSVADLPDRMISQRNMLFAKPEHYFDPFASPLLFFRSPGVDVPPAPRELPISDLDQLSLWEREEYFREQAALRPSEPDKLGLGPSLDLDKVKRKASRRYPPLSSRLLLPPFNISAGADSILGNQATSLTKVLRQSFIRQSLGSNFGRKELTEDELATADEDELTDKRLMNAQAAEKAQLKLHDGLGLWDDSHAGQARVAEVARWLHERLM